MYRILLADDEKIVTDSMTMIINRKFPGQFEIQTAGNGRHLIEKCNSFRPDIVVADIQMPGINGIAAIRELRMNHSGAIFIIMTAYDRFDYAKEALNLGVEEFLNKPFNDRVIAELLNRCIEKIERKRKQLSDSLEIQEKMETVIPVIENGFIYSLLFADNTNEDEVENYRNLLNIEEEYGCMLLITVGEGVKNRRMINSVGSGVRLYQCYSMVSGYIRETWPKAIVGNVTSNRIPVFLPMASEHLEYEDRIQILEEARKLARKLKETTERVFRIGIGSVMPMQNGMNSFKEASRALESGEGSAVHIEDISAPVKSEEPYPADLEKMLYTAQKKSDITELKRIGLAFINRLIEIYGEQDAGVRMKLLEVVLIMEREADQENGNPGNLGSRGDYISVLYQAEQVGDLRLWFTERIANAYDRMHVDEGEHDKAVIEKAKKYIKKHFTSDVSLDDVSRNLNLTPYYFSKLFKKETGSTFMEYLTGLRMAHAKQLLQDGERSIKDICVSVGYSDPNYFSRIFKKVVELTPTEYREQL